MYLFFDTETTGLPKDRHAPLTDLNNWPRLVQLAWFQYDKSEKQISSYDYIIKPYRFTIPQEATKVHGISNERAHKEGVALKKVLNEFAIAISQSDFIIAHNLEFDEKVVGAEFLREGILNSFFKTTRICTMKISTDFCQIPGLRGYKWPSLSELYYTLFKSHYKEAHNAFVDVKICADCFFELKKLGIMDQ